MATASWSKTQEVQCRRTPLVGNLYMSATEMARMVAHHYGWKLDGQDRLFSENLKMPIAFSLDDLAQALLDLNWIRDGKQAAFHNSSMPPKHRVSQAQEAVRSVLVSEKRGFPAHPRVNGS